MLSAVRRSQSLLLAAALLAVAMTPACRTAGRAATQAQEVAAHILLPVAQEEALGQELAQQFEAEVELVDDPSVQGYVQDLGRRLLQRAADVPEGLDFTFKVVDDDMVNAVALPGGTIYVFTGLMKAADSEAELAGVLAHEIAHVTERHIAERLVTLYGMDLLSQIALGQSPHVAAQIAATLLQGGAALKFSRDDEREADIVGVVTLMNAGYEPDEMVGFFKKLAAASETRAPAFLLTHPQPEERVENLEAFINSHVETPNRVAREPYQEIKRRI